MFNIPHSTKIYIAIQPVDMRKGFNGLFALVTEKLGGKPLSGSLFVFTNKSRNRVKILYWDGSGLWVFAKRLEEGRFSWPVKAQRGKKLRVEPAALSMLLAGIELKQGMKKAWYEA